MVKIKIKTLLFASAIFMSIFGVYESRAMETKEQAQEEDSFWAALKKAWNNFDKMTDKIVKADVESIRREQKKDGERIIKALHALGVLEKEEDIQSNKSSSAKSAETKKENANPTNQK